MPLQWEKEDFLLPQTKLKIKNGKKMKKIFAVDICYMKNINSISILNEKPRRCFAKVWFNMFTIMTVCEVISVFKF